MNKIEYQDYENRVASFGERTKVHVFSPLFPDGDPFFSWNPCDCCNRPSGGSRYEAWGLDYDLNKIDEYQICSDCYYYFEYGQLDDTAMMEIEKDGILKDHEN